MQNLEIGTLVSTTGLRLLDLESQSALDVVVARFGWCSRRQFDQ
jgi:hypothetical protein